LNAATEADYKTLVTELNALDDVSVLINDTGMVWPGGYENQTPASVQELLRTNVHS